ncbi:MAG: HEAT repeat domain-containing protein, partial [Planctomycetota bacterium]|nr:HEAT repeat domain-containing protein [Planctomycetota bacterium]
MLLPYSRLLFLSSALLCAAPADIPDVLTEESGKFQRLLASPVPDLRIEGAQGAFHLKLQSLEPNLIQLLQDKDPQVRQEAVKALSRCGTWKAVPDLIALLGEDSSWPVREHSLLALRRISGKSPGPAKPLWEKWWSSTSLKEKQKRLFAEMASPDPDKRLAAARSLRCMATPESEAQILELLEKSNLIGPEQRALLTEALGRIGTVRSFPYLLSRASAGDRAAAWAVGRRGGKEAEGALLKGFRRNRSMDFMLNLDRVKSGKCGPFVAALCRELPSLINNSQRSEDVRFDPSPRQRVTANLIRRSGRGPALVDLVLKQLEGTVEESSVPKDLRPLLNQMCTIVQPGFIREGFG